MAPVFPRQKLLSVPVFGVCAEMTVVHFWIFSYYYHCFFEKKRYDNTETCRVRQDDTGKKREGGTEWIQSLTRSRKLRPQLSRS